MLTLPHPPLVAVEVGEGWWWPIPLGLTSWLWCCLTDWMAMCRSWCLCATDTGLLMTVDRRGHGCMHAYPCVWFGEGGC